MRALGRVLLGTLGWRAAIRPWARDRRGCRDGRGELLLSLRRRRRPRLRSRAILGAREPHRGQLSRGQNILAGARDYRAIRVTADDVDDDRRHARGRPQGVGPARVAHRRLVRGRRIRRGRCRASGADCYFVQRARRRADGAFGDARQIRRPLDDRRAVARSCDGDVHERAVSAVHRAPLHARAAGADHDRDRYRRRQRRRRGRARRAPWPLRLCLGGITRSELDARIEITPTPLTAQLPRLPPGLAAIRPVGGVVGLFSPAVSSSQSDRYSLAAELFPTRALGIRVSYAGFDGDDLIDGSYALDATWFFRRNIGARLGLSRTKSELQLQDVEAVGLQLIGRL
jgi:hypothetical protein